MSPRGSPTSGCRPQRSREPVSRGQQGEHGPRATTPRAPWEFRARGGGASRFAGGTSTLTGPLESEDGPRFPQRGRCHCLAYPCGPAQPLAHTPSRQQDHLSISTGQAGCYLGKGAGARLSSIPGGQCDPV